MNNQKSMYVYLARINDLFERKGWLIDTKNKTSLYNRYVQTCNLLSEDEVNLFLEISDEYQMITIDQYPQQIIDLLKTAVNKYPPQKRSQILVFPMKKDEDDNSIKSADLVSYLCKSVCMKYDDELANRTVIVIKNIEEMKAHMAKIKNGNPIYVLDDFIGSGEYASEVIEELENSGVPKDQIIICCLYLFELGKARLDKSKVKYIYNELIQGVLPKMTGKKIEILRKMSDKLKIKEENVFGYNGSGAAITLIRTPNNTIPIFCENIKGKKNAPFPRNK